MFTYSDKSNNTVSLVCLISKFLYWDSLLSLVQELLCPEKYIGYSFKEWNKYFFYTEKVLLMVLKKISVVESNVLQVSFQLYP